jgi:nicotinate-nucleotide pyrophosphorylase (carboxylating)
MSIPQPVLTRIVRAALEEDFGRGDLTTDACIDEGSLGSAVMRAREPLVFCGGAVVAEVYTQLDPRLVVARQVADGSRVAPGAEVIRLQGPARAILWGERVALNFAQHLSGVASATRALVDELPAGSTTRITDTRKTTPGLRALERHAVRCGGGHNHREDLGAAVLIKDNHIAACGGIRTAVMRARANAPHTCRITCEVDTEGQLDEALQAGVDVVLLDNFDDDRLARLVARVSGRALTEVSGRVSAGRVAAIATAAVDVISVGALTHSARAVDLGLDWA